MAPFCAHPVQRGAGVEAAGKGDADFLSDGQALKDVWQGVSEPDLISGTSSAIRQHNHEALLRRPGCPNRNGRGLDVAKGTSGGRIERSRATP